MNVRANASRDRYGSRTELIMLVLASLACVTVLVLAVSDGRLTGLGGARLNHLLAFAVVAGALGLAAIAGWRLSRDARYTSSRARQEAEQLRRSLVTA